MIHSKSKVTIAEICNLHNLGIIGTIECRNWLAEEFPGFSKSRRKDVDESIEAIGEQMKNASVRLDEIEDFEDD